MKDSENIQDHIDDIMDWFDFDRMLKMMQAVGWEWWGRGVIDQADLRKAARENLTKAWNDCVGESLVVSSGGVKATCHKDGEVKWLELDFDACNWSTVNEE